MTTDDILEKQRAQWKLGAVGWEKWTDWGERWSRTVGEWLCDGLIPGMHVLDVASGVGQPALRAARRVAPDGTVLATDLSPDMLAVAARRAGEAGLANLTCRVMNAQALDLPDASVDVVTCQYGLMFCPDPARAAAEMRRVLRPGGRAAIAVWDVAEHNPFFETFAQAVAPLIQSPPVDPKAPGVFRLAPPGELEAVLRAGGFADVRVESVASAFECDSPEQYWDLRIDHAASARMAIEALPASDQARARAAVLQGTARFVRDGHLWFESASWCARAVA